MRTKALSNGLVGRLIASRRSTAVLKLELLRLRSEVPIRPIFAFEGDGDKAVYHQWVRVIEPGLRYEAFTCGGKRYVLELKGVVDRDLGELSRNLYFFIDHDFDGLRGYSPSPAIFVTDAYSIENYLVEEVILESILDCEFHCNGYPLVRAQICEAFLRLYDKFLVVSKDLNRRIFWARMSGTEIVGGIPDKISSYIKVSLDDVCLTGKHLQEFIIMATEPTEGELAAIDAQFDRVVSRSGYRGKFAMCFFLTWLELLAGERRTPVKGTFSPLKSKKVRIHEICMSLFASRSAPPDKLSEFIQRVTVKNGVRLT